MAAVLGPARRVAVRSLALGAALPRLDDGIDPFPWLFSADLEVVSDVLTTIAGAMISVTGVVFSVTMVILQLASSRSPRVPATSVALAYVYVIVAVGLFVAFIRHITSSVQVSQVMVRYAGAPSR